MLLAWLAARRLSVDLYALASAVSATTVAESLRLAGAAQQHGVVGHIFISLGVSMLYPTENTPTALLERADAALYAAKHQGRNRVCVQA